MSNSTLSRHSPVSNGGVSDCKAECALRNASKRLSLLKPPWQLNSAVAKPSSNAPVLFDVECESSTIKQRKDGSYKLVMEDVERVHWDTDDTYGDPDDPEESDVLDETTDAEEGYYSAEKYAKNYDNYYGKDAEVNAYETFTLADGSKEKCKFTITDAKYNEESNKLVYDITPKNKK